MVREPLASMQTDLKIKKKKLIKIKLIQVVFGLFYFLFSSKRIYFGFQRPLSPTTAQKIKTCINVKGEMSLEVARLKA